MSTATQITFVSKICPLGKIWTRVYKLLWLNLVQLLILFKYFWSVIAFTKKWFFVKLIYLKNCHSKQLSKICNIYLTQQLNTAVYWIFKLHVLSMMDSFLSMYFNISSPEIAQSSLCLESYSNNSKVKFFFGIFQKWSI